MKLFLSIIISLMPFFLFGQDLDNNCSEKLTLKLMELNTKDTLILVARLSECGEFGGSDQSICVIRQSKKTYSAYLTMDKRNGCEKVISMKILDKKLTRKEIALIEKYFTDLNKMRCLDGPPPNAYQVFEVNLKKYHFEKTDWSDTWNEFHVLRKKIFGA